MAKKENKESSFSWQDFVNKDESPEIDNELETPEEVEEEEQLDQEEEEVQEVKFKAKVKKKSKSQPSAEEEEETEEEPVEEKPKVTPKKKETQAKVKEEEEPVEEETEQEDEEQDEDYATQFMSRVQAITGNEVEVEYGETDPVSPEGFALREKAVKEQTLDNFLQELESNHPSVYKALVYENNGGNISDLFKQSTSRDYSKVELKEGDSALATEILKEYYQLKGVKNPARIATLLAAAEDSEEGIVKEAQGFLTELREEQEEERSEMLKGQEQKASEQKRRDQVFVASMDEVLDSRKLGNFKIGDKTEAAQFRDFVHKNVRRDGDKYIFANQVDPANLEKLLQFQYFMFKKGDLASIIQQKAATINANKLSLRLRQEQVKTKKGSEADRSSGFSLRDFES